MEFPEDRKAPLYGSFYRFEKPKIVSRIIASKMRWDNHEFTHILCSLAPVVLEWLILIEGASDLVGKTLTRVTL